MGGFGPMPGQVHHFICSSRTSRTRATGWSATRQGDAAAVRRAGPPPRGREFVAGALSIADFAILGWAWRHERHKVDLTDFPNVERWYDTLMARPATKRGMEAKLD